VRVLPVEQANERRLAKALRAFLEGKSNCGLKWIRGVIGIEAPLANVLLLTHLVGYANSEKYRDLCANPFTVFVEFSCDCDSAYRMELQTVLGVNPGFLSFECVKCGQRHETDGVVNSVFRRNEYSGQWDIVSERACTA
jgi:hypothetical protein